MRQRTSGASGYLDAGGVVGAGADGDPGAGGVAGTDTGGASRTTDEDRSPPRIASENEVRVKMIAITPVILPSTVGVPIEPNTAWLPAPPKAEPISAPLPACSSTMAMMAKHISTWMIVSAMTIYSPLVAAPDRKSTRLNSSHLVISYAVFCLKKKKKLIRATTT